VRDIGRKATRIPLIEQSKMPPTNPGSVPEDKMWLITAYILQKNGFAAGSTPLNAQTAARPLG
jgi:hypothetical protein